MSEKFFAAVKNACVADATLVALLGHTSSELRIGLGDSNVVSRIPFLAIDNAQTVPLVDNGPTTIKESVVTFRCTAKTQLLAVKVLDRLDALMGRSGYAQHLTKWDVSDASVRNKWTRFLSRSKPVWMDKTNRYEGKLLAVFVWNLL